MQDVIAKAGLSFFGMLTASISHELKNRMAIINEEAGLLDDFVQLDRMGKALDPQRIARLAGQVKAQVSLADGLLKSMNILSHSVDTLCSHVEIGRLLQVTIDLTQRLVHMRNIQLCLSEPDKPVTASTSPFLLMNLIWLCLDAFPAEDGNGKQLVLGCERSGDECVVWISATDAEPEGACADPGEMARLVADSIDARVEIRAKTGDLAIRLPARPVAVAEGLETGS